MSDYDRDTLRRFVRKCRNASLLSAFREPLPRCNPAQWERIEALRRAVALELVRRNLA